MLKKFLPKGDNFFLFFEQHAFICVKATETLLSFKPESYPLIKACEEEADAITHRCVEALHTQFITPIDRGVIHKLINTMDDIVDEVNAISKLLILYKLNILSPGAQEVAILLHKAAIEIAILIKHLNNKKKFDLLKQNLFTISKLETQADNLFMKEMAHLFENEKDPLTVIKWKEIFEHLEKAVNVCDDVANIIEGIILENE